MLDGASGLIQKIYDVATLLWKSSKTTSLVEVTKPMRVEPLTVISRDCMTVPELGDVLQSLLSLFSGYYLQAVSVIGNVQSVKVAKVLDSLNPDRDFDYLGEGAKLLGFEDYSEKNTFTMYDEAYRFRLPTSLNRVGIEENQLSPEQIQEIKDSELHTSVDITKISEISNLAVGKLLNVEISIGEEKSSKFPVSVRLIPSMLPNSSILHILALKTEDTSFTERFHAWRAGRISLIKDLILAQDLIDEHKKALMEDQSGVYSEIMRRVNNAKKFGLITRNPSLVSASNLFVISKDVARELELKLGGKLSNARIREKAFQNTYAMIIVVLDTEMERVTFYNRGTAAATDISFREIKASAKGKGPDILDVLRALNLGSAPAL
jgi:hypothetical protein